MPLRGKWEGEFMANKQLLKKSFDMKYFRTQCLSACGVIGGVLIAACALFIGTGTVRIIGIVIYLLLMTPIILYYVFRMWEIARRPERYVLCDAVARKAYSTFGRKIYFVVDLTLPDGRVVTAETRGVFSPSILTDAYWGEIQGQRLKVLYDETEESVVVVERME